MRINLTLSLLAFATLLLLSCNKTLSPEEQLAKDIEDIEKYIADKGLTAQTTPSGLHYIITTEGTGSHPALNNTVDVRYNGYLLDGTVFDHTTGNDVATFPLKNLITGWQEAIPLLKEGGKGTFWIPSALCYGPNGSGPIPPNSPLIFEIELVNF